jgi:hypothetical protein
VPGMRSSGSKPDLGALAQEWPCGRAERKDESISAFIATRRLEIALHGRLLHQPTWPYEREVAVLQVRAAAVAGPSRFFS